MSQELLVRIFINNPILNYDFALRGGPPGKYKLFQKQHSNGEPLQFDFKIRTQKIGYFFDSSGKFVYGTKRNRFFDINIGNFPKEEDSIWRWRLKIPFSSISNDIIIAASGNNSVVVVTQLEGFVMENNSFKRSEKPCLCKWIIQKIY